MVELKDSEGRIWSILLGGTPLSPVSIQLDGEKLKSYDISISIDTRPNRLLITRNGVEKVAFYAKVGDKWWIHFDGNVSVFDVIEPGTSASGANEEELTAPMPGKVLEVLVPEGAKVSDGQPLMVLEAMKMEHRILADRDGIVSAIHYSPGDQVDAGSVLLDLNSESE